MSPIRPLDNKNDTAWSNIPEVAAGTNLDDLRRTGVFTVVNPVNPPTPGPGSYFITCYDASIAGERHTVQRARNATTGEEMTRSYGGSTWTSWASGSGSGSGGSGSGSGSGGSGSGSGSGSGGSGSGVTPWSRPADWLSLPADAADTIVILTAVFNDAANFATVFASVTGGYTVDWGDGVIENVNSSTQRDHVYDYNDPSLNGSLSSLGYKQAIITITPQVNGNSFTSLNLARKRTGSSANPMISRWLDIRINCPSATSVTIASSNVVQPTFLQRCAFTGFGSLANGSSLFYKCIALQQVDFADGMLNSTSSLNNIFGNCESLETVTFPAGSLVSTTNMSLAFSRCYSLQEVNFPDGGLTAITTLSQAFLNCYSLPTMSFPAGSLASVTNIVSMFSECYGLKTVTWPDGGLASTTLSYSVFSKCYNLTTMTFPAGSLSSTTRIDSLFDSCYNLMSVSFPTGSLAAVTNWSYAFQHCESLKEVILPAGGLSSVTQSVFVFSNCVALEKVQFPTGSLSSATSLLNILFNCFALRSVINLEAPKSVNVSYGALDGAALDAIYTSLPTVVGQTITVSGQPGAANDTPTIATNKGWTVSG